MTQVIFTEEFDLDWNLYFGQLHAHTDISNGAGSVEEAFNMRRRWMVWTFSP